MLVNFKTKNIKAVVFDYDNTLADESYWIKNRWKKTNQFVENKYNFFNYSQAFWENYYCNDNIFNIVNKTLNDIDANISVVDDIVNFYKKAIVNEKLFKGSIGCLNYLKKNNYLIGIITNGKKHTHEDRIKKAKLFKYIDVVLYGDEKQKPSIDLFIECANKLNIEIHNMVYIGDDYNNDYLASERAGCIPILFDNKKMNTSKNHCNKINSLKSLIKIF